MKGRFLFFSLCLIISSAKAQQDSTRIPDTINQRIFLIGDAGEMLGTTHPVIAWLKKHVDWNDEKNTVIYLGDNVYPEGLPLEGEPGYEHSKAILDDQISLVKGKKAKAFFIPGNHDWRNGKMGGWEQAMNQMDYINAQDLKNVQAWPLHGCPGPIPVELTDKVVVVLIDSQWFLYLHDKPGPGSNCEAKTLDEFGVELRQIADEHPNQLLVIATHHPMISYGPHGGDYTWKEHLFPFTALSPNLYIPLPVLGSVYPIARGVFGNVQDIPHPLYKTMINTIEEAVRKHPYRVFVAGHDHGLQYNVRITTSKDTVPYVVSGSGSKLSRIKPGRFSKFADAKNGFAVLEVWQSGKTDIRYYDITSKDFDQPVFSADLKTIMPPPPPEIDTTRIVLDSVVYKAADPRLAGNGIEKFLWGKNYRKEWTQPLALPVLDMGSELGGLTPIRQAGGTQTKVLRVQDSSGKEWSLRSVLKDPEAAIPPDLREAFPRDIIKDGLSASYPFGALSMASLSKAAGVPYLHNRLVYLPDDPRLLRFRSGFKNMMALMEENQPAGVKETEATEDLFVDLEDNIDNRVDQKAVLRARLLDNFVMDFDRNESQWLWATQDTGQHKTFFPIPKNRDQVFFVNEGIIPKIVRNQSIMPEVQGFQPKAENIKTFNHTARNFDRNFLTELTEADWRRSVDSFLSTMTDNAIETALKQQPPSVQKYSADQIVKTLKERRKYFAGEMMEYYRFLSRLVSIPGSNNREQFTVIKNDDGSVRVIVNKIAEDSSLSTKVYDRLFDPSVTKELRLYGLKGNDRFVVEGPRTPIKIRLIGGGGKDEFINNGTSKKVQAYDVSFEENKFGGKTGFMKRVYPDPQTNRFDRLNYKYNVLKPGLVFDYNVDDGVVLGPRLEYTHHGFRKEPYGMRQMVEGTYALNTGSTHFRYEADFIKLFRNNDILVRADIKAPKNVTNFFGLGNNSSTDADGHNVEYYRAQYDIINASVYMSRQLQSWMRFKFGPSFQYFRLDSGENAGRFVTSMDARAQHRVPLAARNYAGADGRVQINSLNNSLLPTRGLAMDAGIRQLFGLEKNSNSVTQANIDMRIYMSLFTFKRLVLATRWGWAGNFGRFEFPQAVYLGGTDNLRGYRKQRFAGRSMVYNSLELRIKLTDFNTYLFGGSVGVFVFNDVGRVFMDDESSRRWHDGFGAGMWVAPVKRFVLAASFAHSQEEKLLPRLTFGFQF